MPRHRGGAAAWLAAAGAAAVLLGACSGAGPPNILLIVADTARADRFTPDPRGAGITPSVTALGREGAAFRRAYTSSPWTLPAHASLFTGLYPSSHGADSGALKLDERLPFLARRLQAAGYRTQAYIANPWVGKDYNFHTGFDTFDEVWRVVRGTSGDMGAGSITAKVERWLQWRDGNPDAAARPFFLFINFFEPHLPYNPPEPERSRHLPQDADPAAVERLRRFQYPDDIRQLTGDRALGAAEVAILSALYDGENAYVDRQIGAIADALRRRDLLDRTVVVVTSDHGEMLGEHGLVDHKLDLYEPVLRIPLILRYPPAVAPGQVLEVPVLLQDLYPTLLALSGAVPPDGKGDAPGGEWPPEARPLPGVKGLQAGPPRGVNENDPLIAEYASPGEFLQVMKGLSPALDVTLWDRTLVAYRASGLKLIWGSDGRHRLHDLAADPDEAADMATRDPDMTGRLAAATEAWLGRKGARPPLARPSGEPTASR